MGQEGVGTDVAAKPFLRWVGGKRWLLDKLPFSIDETRIRNYFEPFLGGGALFLRLQPSGTVHLSDLNCELIDTYRQVRRGPVRVHEALRQYANTAECYYRVRSHSPSTGPERAARFIYLNHTSFNGIYRVNLAGQYNVPFGNRDNPMIPGLDHLRGVARALRGARLSVADFESATAAAGRGDLVFLDPPYTVAHSNNGFVKYNQRLFSFEDQHRLRNLLLRLRRRGAYYLMTNAAHDSIAELFDIGDSRFEVNRRNVVGGTAAKRGSVTEYVFTNLRAHD